MNSIQEGRVESRKIEANRLDIIAKVEANRAKHIAEYKEAMKGYREEAQRLLRNAVAMLSGQINDIIKPDGPAYIQQPSLSLTVPQSHEEDYDTVIEMLKMETREKVMVSTEEFTCYCMDKWAWKATFAATNMRYSNKG
jgi:hypothetical protein